MATIGKSPAVLSALILAAPFYLANQGAAGIGGSDHYDGNNWNKRYNERFYATGRAGGAGGSAIGAIGSSVSSILIHCETSGVHRAYYLSKIDPNDVAVYVSPDNLAGTITIKGKAESVGAERVGKLRRKNP